MAKKAQAQAGDLSRLEMSFDKPHLINAVFGEFDRNLVTIENRLGVYISARGNRVQIEGEAGAVGVVGDASTGEGAAGGGGITTGKTQFGGDDGGVFVLTDGVGFGKNDMIVREHLNLSSSRADLENANVTSITSEVSRFE